MGNPAIYDGKKLFSAEHRNLLKTGSGITKAAVQSMILTLSTQKDEFGQPIIIRPGAFIVPVGMSFDVYTLFNSPTINTEGNTDPDHFRRVVWEGGDPVPREFRR